MKYFFTQQQVTGTVSFPKEESSRTFVGLGGITEAEKK